MGHSMGGAEVLALASTAKYAALVNQIRGILLESPYIALSPASAPSRILMWLGLAALRVFPKQQISHRLPVETCSRDPEVHASLLGDKLRHGMGTLETFNAMTTRAADLDSGRYVLNEGAVKSLWIAHGSGDQCTSHDASKRWLERQDIPDKEFKSYDGWSHQLHADLPGNTEVFARDCANWILGRLS
jgi:acylglycerol lipase